ncbi:MAG: hypothetical protein LBT86_10660 [Deltaproteobacteria bacterium]|jgi:ABC-type Fe3+ transport system substrate-binding protein|nr:hypothetical protein [Deltaproteobacteria bacterium]
MEEVVAITRKNDPSAPEARRRENANLLVDWILSAEGQELVRKTGYVPIQ